MAGARLRRLAPPLLVLALRAHGVSFLERPGQDDAADLGGKVLMATMTFPEDNLPLDITVGHQLRMATKHPEKVQHVIVDNRPPWMDPVNRQEDILRSMDSNGTSSVRRVDYGVYDDPTYLQKFIDTGDRTDSVKTLEDAQDRSDISGQHMSSNSMGMFNFLDHCLNADSDVDICVFLDPDIVVYREDEGMIEMARKLFWAKPPAIMLNPPTMCSALDASDSGTCTSKKHGMVSQRYLIIHRQRLASALPLKIPHAEFLVNFEHLMTEGMRHHNWVGGQRMYCKGAFAIHPFSMRWAHCRNKRENLNIERHSRLISRGEPNKLAADRLAEYHSFDTAVVEGLREMHARVEAGKLAKPEDPWSVTNMCEDMCVCRDRVAEGLAW